MLNRCGRPTLRVLREDLGLSISDTDTLDAHSPLSGIDHPIVRKAAESFGIDAASDHHEGFIRSSDRHRLLEIKSAQWRGGVWIDDDDVPWLIVAGLAKGGHLDHDDFYVALDRANSSGTIDQWLPAEADYRHLKREQASRRYADWQLEIQRTVLKALTSVARGGTTRFCLPHPVDPDTAMGAAELTVERFDDPDYKHQELVVEIALDNQFKSSELGWAATTRVLIAINPPETGWDAAGDIYSTLSEFGDTEARVLQLQASCDLGELAQSCPNEIAHYCHRGNLSDATINGKGVRSLCGVYFVPTRDHQALPVCETCEQLYNQLP